MNRNTLTRLFLLIGAIAFLFFTFGMAFCYEMGKNGIDHINWLWILKINIPPIIGIVVLLILRERITSKK